MGTLYAPRPDATTEALATEWLLANGLGSYAMGTALGVNTRRYHGLLVAATRPPVDRIVAVHSLIEQLVTEGETLDLSTQQVGEELLLHPQGWRHFSGFACRPPTACHWLHRAGDVLITRYLNLQPARNVILIRYDIRGVTTPSVLRLRPLTPLRSLHSLDCESSRAPRVTPTDDRSLEIRREHHALKIHLEGGRWRLSPQWWREIAYAQDRARGQDWLEDVWSPGLVEVALEPMRRVEVMLSFTVPAPAPRIRANIRAVQPGDDAVARLRAAASPFIASRQSGDEWSITIMAGYPWFADWGRDAMISLPGLLLCTDRLAEARSALHTFARHMRDGLLPNCFRENEPPLYNAADASLWFIHAVRAYARASNDDDLGHLLDAARTIINCYCEGTAYGIRLCDDGLITAGDGTDPLTWMDARRNGVTFTPRDGKTIEINALWHNALLCLAEMSDERTEAAELHRRAERAAEAIQSQFWWQEMSCLHDVLRLPRPDHGSSVHSHRSGAEWEPDGKLRPNQIFAVSLPFSPLTRQQQQSVVRVVRARLLTPYGLRTLDPQDPDYCARFEGDLMQRDRAYHNGTVWPWLIGAYCDAVLRAGAYGEEALVEVRRAIQPLLDDLDRGCVHQVAEVYDADPPHRPSGCPAQAWSVAEVLRVTTVLEGLAGDERGRGVRGREGEE